MLDGSGVENVIEACVNAAKCPLGKFYPDKDYGSTLSRRYTDEINLCYIRRTLAGFDGVFVHSLTVTMGRASLLLMINNEEREVEFYI